MASTIPHEPLDQLSAGTRDMHRALSSLMEELEAIDWYQQRSDVCSSTELKSVLLHNMDEEVEHAAMLMEWVRRNSPRFDEMMRKYLFQEEAIVTIERKPR